MYTVVNAEVITQMQATVMRKGQLLTQVFTNFEHIERQVAETYLAAVSNGGAVAAGSSAVGRVSTTGPTMSEFISRMGNVGKQSANGADGSGLDAGVAISLGMEGQGRLEGQPDTHSTASRGSLSTSNLSSNSSYSPSTPPPPSYTPNPYMSAPVAAAAGKRPSSPQPHPPPPPPPPPAKHL